MKTSCFALFFIFFSNSAEAERPLINYEDCGTKYDCRHEFVVPPQFDYIWGFDQKGKTSAWGFYKGLALVQQGQQLGVIDTTGNFVLPLTDIDSAQEFYEKRTGLQPGILQYKHPEVFHDTRDIDEERDGFGIEIKRLVTKEEEKKENEDENKDPTYDSLDFYQGLSVFQEGEKWGVVNKRGHVIVSPRFESLLHFRDGLAAAKSKGKWGFIRINVQEKVQETFPGYRR